MKIKKKKGKRASRPIAATIKGRGGYLTDLANGISNAVTYNEDKTAYGSAARKVAELGSKAFDLPSGVSRVLGNAASWFTSLFGGGRYHLKRNSLLRAAHMQVKGRGSYETLPWAPESKDSGFITNSVPEFKNKGSGFGSDITVCHREYIGDVGSHTSFLPTTMPINPGNNTMFPWLSKIANLYEEYEFLGLIFEYKTMSATAVGTTSSAMGTVIMATDYDCLDNNFTTKRAMEAAEYSCNTVPFETFVHPVECDPRRNFSRTLFVQPGLSKSGSAPGDPRLSVLGNFTYATQGQQADGTAIGELWVSYHVRLSRPVLEDSANTGVYSAHASTTLSTSGVPSSLVVNATNSTLLNIIVNGTGVYAIGSVMAATNNAVGCYHISVHGVTNSAAAWASPAAGTPVLMGGATSPMMAYNALASPDAASCMYQKGVQTSLTYNPTQVAVQNYIVRFDSASDGLVFPLYHNTTSVTGVDIYVSPWSANIVSVPRPIDSDIATRIAKLEEVINGKDEASDDDHADTPRPTTTSRSSSRK